MKKHYKILALGDTVGAEATDKVCRCIGKIKLENDIDIAIVNGENAAQGNGLDKKSIDLFMSSGIDVITSGNHIWKKREIQDCIEQNKAVIRPANYPDEVPGKGFYIFDSYGIRTLVINVLGITYMEPLSSPFDTVEKILSENNGLFDISFLDFHAEATSEKLALANYFDGKISVIAGTHTHVQTSDARILPNGTGYITDLGMCGAIDSVLGVKKENIIQKFKTHMPVKFENPTGITELNGAIFTVDIQSKKTVKIEVLKKNIG